MVTANKQKVVSVLKISAIALGVLAVIVVGYRYYNRPVQTWNADLFEGKNPDKIATKGQGQKYWQASQQGQGFYVTDNSVAAGDLKTYCVSGAIGGVKGATAQFEFGGQSFNAKNGFFTRCADVTVQANRQIKFEVNDGELQVYRVDRKR